MTNEMAVTLCGVLFVASVVVLMLDVAFLRTLRRYAPSPNGTLAGSVDFHVDASAPAVEAQARKAVAESGLTGAEADRLFDGIMEGIRRAKASGKDSGMIAVTIDPDVSVEMLGKFPLHVSPAALRRMRAREDDDDGMLN